MYESPAQEGGIGLDPTNPLFQLRTGTITINQQNTTAEGAIKGKLRISETGDQFDEMKVTLLRMPVLQRQYYVGQPGTMFRKPENLVCFSRDNERPDEAAREPQAINCASCAQGDINWEKWKQTKQMSDAPPCNTFYHAEFIDTQHKWPLQMYIRSKNQGPFRNGMKEWTRIIHMMRAEGLNPNVFDVSFKLSTQRILTNGLPSYVLNLSDFKAIQPEERAEFGKVYTTYIEAQEARYATQLTDGAQERIDRAVAEATY